MQILPTGLSPIAEYAKPIINKEKEKEKMAGVCKVPLQVQ
jgi:hypothetical protein